MRTENTTTFLGQLLDKVRPSDLLHSEHRMALRKRIEHLLENTGLEPSQFGSHVRKELNDLRGWLSSTRSMTLETLTEICCILHISVGDLVAECA